MITLTHPLRITFPYEKFIVGKTSHSILYHKYHCVYIHSGLTLYEIQSFYLGASIFLRYLST